MTPHLSVGRTVCTTRTVMLRDSAAGLELRNSERNSFPKQKARVYTRARPAADPGHADGLNRFQRGTVRIANRTVDGYIRVLAPSWLGSQHADDFLGSFPGLFKLSDASADRLLTPRPA